jgi:hypothetical protein
MPGRWRTPPSAGGRAEARRDRAPRPTRPRRRPERERQFVESVFWTLKNRLGLERRQARTLPGNRARIGANFLTLAAGISLNHLRGGPTRQFADLTT